MSLRSEGDEQRQLRLRFAAPRRDFELTEAEFDRIRELVREHTGIALSEAKRQLVYGRLARRLRALKLGNFAEYIELLERGDPAELEEFTNAVTTNLTSFFREPHHFEYLAREALPAIVAGDTAYAPPAHLVLRGFDRRGAVFHRHGAARGAALLTGWDVKLLATDLDSAVLATGAAGVYADGALQGHGAQRASRSSSTRAAACRPASSARATSCAA